MLRQIIIIIIIILQKGGTSLDTANVFVLAGPTSHTHERDATQISLMSRLWTKG